MASKTAQQLAQRLKLLRESHFPERRLTQSELASAFSLGLATVASWENSGSPKLPPEARLETYAVFFATGRSLIPKPHLLRESELTDKERAACEALKAELLGLREAVRRPVPATPRASRRTWKFDEGPVNIICPDVRLSDKIPAGPLSDESNPNYMEMLSYADLDALIELHGHVRAENPDIEVFHRLESKAEVDHLSSHLVVLGGVAWNDLAGEVMDRSSLPVRQISDPAVPSGEVFEVVTGNRPQRVGPRWAGDDPGTPEAPGQLVEDVALLARLPNPFNPERTLTVCNGVHSRGVLGAVRCLTDARYRAANEAYIAERFSPGQTFAMLLRVQVIKGRAMTPALSDAKCRLFEWPGEPNTP